MSKYNLQQMRKQAYLHVKSHTQYDLKVKVNSYSKEGIFGFRARWNNGLHLSSHLKQPQTWTQHVRQLPTKDSDF